MPPPQSLLAVSLSHSMRNAPSTGPHNVALPPMSIDLWHDRAALHFLVEPAAARAYAVMASPGRFSRRYALPSCVCAYA